jgi:hypothetical protein
MIITSLAFGLMLAKQDPLQRLIFILSCDLPILKPVIVDEVANSSASTSIEGSVGSDHWRIQLKRNATTAPVLVYQGKRPHNDVKSSHRWCAGISILAKRGFLKYRCEITFYTDAGNYYLGQTDLPNVDGGFKTVRFRPDGSVRDILGGL